MNSAGEVSLEISGLATVRPKGRVLFGSTERRNTIVSATIALLVILVGFSPAFEASGWLMDEGMILVYPELMQQGKLPYRDFETFYGPASPTLLAAAFSAFGTSIFVERTVGLLYRVAILLALFAITRSWGKTLAVGCLLVAGSLLLGTALLAYAWLGAIACALWSIGLSGRPEAYKQCFFGGLLAGAALLFRVDLGPAIILSACPLLYGMTWPQRRNYLLGGGLALLPLGILTIAIGWRPVLDNLFLMPVIYSSPARHLPLFSAAPYLVGLFFAHLVAALLNVAAGVSEVFLPARTSRGRLLLAVALFALGLTHQAAQRLDPVHLLLAAFLSFGLLPLSLVVIWSRFQDRSPTRSEMVLALVGVVAALQMIAPELSLTVRAAFCAGIHARADTTFVELGGRVFPFSSPRLAASVELMLRKLDALSVGGERLFVGPADLRRTNCNDTFIYHLMPKLAPATYFLEMNPLSANRPGSRLAADIQSAHWLVLNRAWDSWKEPNRSSEYASNVPNEVVRKHFELCGVFGTYLLFHRKN